ncbi:MAG: SAF domain-containing protein [Chloroflexi bacterium]|nr:SAF domain-containing protein [Chloroflexota bacterium]
MKVAPAIRITLTIVGVLMVVVAFVSVLGIGAATNPPPLRVAVAVRDLRIGDRLSPSDYRVVDQIIDPSLARLYVQEGDLPSYEGAYVVDDMRRGDPLNKVKLAAGETDSLRRYALVLTDSEEVVMVMPVNPDIIPGKISAGDYVDILFVGGGDAGINQLPDATQTPIALDQPFTSFAATATPSLAPPIADITPTGMPTITPTSRVVLPLADLMLERVPVLDVNYRQLQNPNYASGVNTNEQPYIDGPITGIVVKVPRSYQTLLGFAIATSKLRFSITSPLMANHDVKPQMGVDWQKYMDVYRWKEMQSILRGETLTNTLFPLYTPVVPPTVIAPTMNTLPTPAQP